MVLLVFQGRQVGRLHHPLSRPTFLHRAPHQTPLLLIQVLMGALGVLAPLACVHIVLVGNVPAYLLPMQSEVLGEGITSGLCVFEAGYDDEFFILAGQQFLL